MESSKYGSTNGNRSYDRLKEDERKNIPKETFSISEPYSTPSDSAPSRGGRLGEHEEAKCCGGLLNRREGTDVFRMIVISMFVFAGGVTVALVIQIASGASGTITNAERVVSDAEACTAIGENILHLGGNAVDAAIAATFCLSVVEPHVTGLGGGGIMLIHKHQEGKTVVIDFRETLPLSASKQKFGDKNPELARTGSSSIGVPGFVAGLIYARQKYGSHHPGGKCCSWRDLIVPTINEAFKVQVGESIVNASLTKLDVVNTEETKLLSEFLNLQDGKPSLDAQDSFYNSSELFRAMVHSLKMISEDEDSFYKGEVGQNIVKEMNGIITLEDLTAYEVNEVEAISTTIGDFEVYASPAPSSGPQLLAFLNTMQVAYGQKNRNKTTVKMDINFLQNVSEVSFYLHTIVRSKLFCHADFAKYGKVSAGPW